MLLMTSYTVHHNLITGNQLPQGEIAVSSQLVATVQSGSIYGQYHQPQLYQAQPGTAPGAEPMVYYQQLQVWCDV